MAGDPQTAVWATDLKSKVIIEISDPENPKIDIHDDISIIFFEFRRDGGRRLTL